MTKLSKFAAACAAVVCAFGAEANAAVVDVVSGNADDAAAIAAAIAAAGEGGVVRLADGTYDITSIIRLTTDVEIAGNDADPSAVRLDGAGKNMLVYMNHAAAKVHGVTFQNGYKDTSNMPSGISHSSYEQAPVFMTNGTFSNCVFSACKGYFSGFTSKGGLIVDCEIRGGKVSDGNDGAAGRGGAIKLHGGHLLRCFLHSSDSAGAPVYCASSGWAVDCVISNMTMRSSNNLQGGGLYLGSGCYASNCVIRACSNSGHGGGVVVNGGRLVNSVVFGNAAGQFGGGVYLKDGTVLNCTVAGNTAGTFGSGVYQTGGSLVNTAIGSLQSIDAVKQVGGTVSHSCGTGLTTGANGNFGVNPIFRDEANGDYTLKGASPCVDAGEARVWHDGAKDVSGVNARVLDGNGDGIAAVDIGAFEYNPTQAPLAISFSAVMETNDGLPRKVVFKPCLEGSYGEATKVVWNFGDGTVVEGTSLEPVDHDFASAGYFTATLTVMTTEAGTLTSEMLDAVKIKPTTVYMSTTGSATPPYASPETATASIADALTALAIPPTGRARIIILDGTYETVTPRPTLDMPIEIVGNDADPTAVTFDGGSKRGFFFVDNADALVHGIRFYKGYMAEQTPFSGAGSFSGSPLVLHYGVVSNCVYESCSGSFCGGISLQGSAKLYDTAISGVTSTDWGLAALGGGLRIYGTATAENCTITTSSCKIGSGAGVHGGTMRNCRVFGNTGASQGGGIYVSGGTVENCVVVSNSMASGGFGGGAYVCGGTLRNSLVAWNSTPSGTGSGAYMTSGNIQNCTVAENEGGAVCNGVHLTGGTLVNSAVEGETVPVNIVGGTVKNCCALSLTTDATTGNIQSEPGFRNAESGDFTLAGSSPCVDAGARLAWHEGATDLTGDTPRVLLGKVAERVDIGAYEYDPSTAPASISFSVTGGEAVVAPHTAIFTPSLEGSCGAVTSCTWDFGDGTAETVVEPGEISHIYEAVGVYAVSVSVVTTLKGTLVATNSAAVRIKPSVVYVATNGTHVAPFHTLATAATNITDALRELGYPTDGTRAKVIVTDGVYPAPSERLSLSTAVEIVGNDSDPTAVTFDGKRMREFFYLDHAQAFVHGMRFWNSVTENRGDSAADSPSYFHAPFELRQGVASNCVFESNSAIFGPLTAWNTGEVIDCRIVGCENRDGNVGGAAQGGGLKLAGSAVCRGCSFTNCKALRGGALAVFGGTAENCTVCCNTSRGDAGGVYQAGGTLRGLLIVGNKATTTMGGLYQTGGTAVNVTIADNVATTVVGASVAGTLVNSIVVGKGEYDPANPPLVVSGDGQVRRCCSPSLTADDCLSVDPAFRNRARGNYRLTQSSPCIDKGDDEAWSNLDMAVDLDGRPRRLRHHVDLGCYEKLVNGMAVIVR